MENRELRIGNKVQNKNGFIFEVVSIFKDDAVYCDFEDNEGDVWEFDKNNPCYGIQLTEEILLKCGFLDFEGWLQKEGIQLFNINNLYYRANFPIKADIKYLHQLQNLYWCLCEKELNVQL